MHRQRPDRPVSAIIAANSLNSAGKVEVRTRERTLLHEPGRLFMANWHVDIDFNGIFSKTEGLLTEIVSDNKNRTRLALRIGFDIRLVSAQ